MSTNTYLEDAMFVVAEDVGEIRSAFVKTVTSQSVLVVPGISMGQTSTFKYGIARTPGAAQPRQVSAYNDASQTITITSAFDGVTVAAGALLEVAWGSAEKYAMARAAVNQAVRESYPYYYRDIRTGDALTGTVAIVGTTAVTGTGTAFHAEVRTGDIIKIGTETRTVDAVTTNAALTVTSAFTQTTSGATCYYASGLTYTTQQHVYRLPPSISELLEIGWALSASDPVSWIPPLSNWRVTGTEGSYYLHLEPLNSSWNTGTTTVATGYAGLTSSGGTFGDRFTGYEIFLHYVSREPDFVSFGDVTNLPMQYFAVASEIYARRRMAIVEPESAEARRLSTVYPLLLDKANAAKRWLYNFKPQIATLQGPSYYLR